MIHQPITAAPELDGPTGRFLIDMNRMAFDGFHQHDPNAPAVFRCYGCDTYRHHAEALCLNCCDVTESYIDGGTIMEKADMYRRAGLL